MQNTNFFALFSLPQSFDIDLKVLETHFRKMQSDNHPDRFVTAPAAEKLAAMQKATLANEAYATIKSPGLRAAYLLGLQGINAVDEKNNQMPADFLMQQMEWREAIEEAENANDVPALESLQNDIRAASKTLQQTLSEQFKLAQLEDATTSTRKLIFLDKVCADIIKTIEKLED